MNDDTLRIRLEQFKRLEYLARICWGSLQKLAQAMGKHPKTLYSYKERASIGIKVFRQLEKVGLSKLYIETGKGSPFTETPEGSALAKIFEHRVPDMNDTEKSVSEQTQRKVEHSFPRYRGERDTQYYGNRQTSSTMAQKMNEVPESSLVSVNDSVVFVKMINVPLNAGNAVPIDYIHENTFKRIPSSFLRGNKQEDVLIFTCNGTSMIHAGLNDGDNVVVKVNNGMTDFQGQMVAVQHNGLAYIKYFFGDEHTQTAYLHSHDGLTEPIYVNLNDDSFRIFGHVVNIFADPTRPERLAEPPRLDG